MSSAFLTDEQKVLDALRDGDESTFLRLVTQHHAAMLRVSLLYVADHAVAEEVVQETWIAVLKGIVGFEGRSSLKTWIFRILTNQAKTRGKRERRNIPFSSFEEPENEGEEPAVAPGRFLPSGHPRWPHHWAEPPHPWRRSMEEQVVSREVLEVIKRAIDRLPANQQAVITLRDIEEMASEEVCNAFGLSETNQRVLLHRARSKVRRALEEYFD
jgi:RNA polymerase sigma-70 factor (ECF subfamily)